MGRVKLKEKVPHTFNFDKIAYFKLKEKKVNISKFINLKLEEMVGMVEKNELSKTEIISRTIGVDEENYQKLKAKEISINRYLNNALIEQSNK